MHLSFKYINILINILLGTAWAVVFYGFFSGFSSVAGNFFLKLISAFIHASVGLFLVLLLEAIYTIFKIYEKQLHEDTK